MDPVSSALLAISIILFFGFFAELAFKRFQIPDLLLLIILGFLLGPNVMGYISPQEVAPYAPLFTTFALMFLLFDGAFNIDLTSFARGLSLSLSIALFNFFFSSMIITGIMVFFGYMLPPAILTGFILGGVSSTFVIPTLKQIKIRKSIYSILALESALTDVFCIVTSITAIELIRANVFDIQSVLSQITSLFAVAGFIGILSGIFWVSIISRMFKGYKSYMVTIAFVILVYVVTVFLGGNGAIAALFVGLVLKNSKKLTEMLSVVSSKRTKKGRKTLENGGGLSITTPSEILFYDQISFFLKVFFFVYIGILLELTNHEAIIIGAVLSIAIMVIRQFTTVFTRQFNRFDRKLANSMFARGLAAATLAQIAIESEIPNARMFAQIAYVAITGTIILSSIMIFILRRERISNQTEQ